MHPVLRLVPAVLTFQLAVVAVIVVVVVTGVAAIGGFVVAGIAVIVVVDYDDAGLQLKFDDSVVPFVGDPAGMRREVG